MEHNFKPDNNSDDPSDLVKRLKIINNLSKNELLKEKHIIFSNRMLGVLPVRCEFLDSTRLVMVFFATSTLDLLDALADIEDDKEKLINWVYSFQVSPNGDETGKVDYGFRGSTSCIAGENINSDICDKAHLAMTYSALATLLILGDNLSRVRKKDILSSLADLQLPNGSFRPMNIDCESDMRYVYCAACVCYILQDWSTIDAERTVQYIKDSKNYDGGIGQGPGLESHGGSTFCAIATLHLMGQLDSAFSNQDIKNLKRWLIFRQERGFQGRPNKPADTCYSFWIGATLKLLGCYDFVNFPEISKFVLSAQDSTTGGISKWVDFSPDMLHTYLGLSGLFLFNNKLSPLVHPALNISQKSADLLFTLHKKWRVQS